MSSSKQIAQLDGVDLAYFDFAPTDGSDGSKVILLVHGFASNASVNWMGTSWSTTLRDAGYRVIALDNRGHGDSSKFYSPTDYGPDIFAADAFKLLDHLGVDTCDVMGYSMGARISCYMAHQAPQRVNRAVFGGMGANIFGGRGGYEAIAQGLEADDPSTISSAEAASFRRFAELTGSDRLALAACIRPSEVQITPDIVGSLKVPVLVAVGSTDGIGGSAVELAKMIPQGEAFVIEGLDHMKATGASSYKRAALQFLGSAT